ncbi:RES family NAD+ phosphorylase [Pseudokineococcus basanitobsidens]|uniref:RES family NAD+ phosphorylase n=1 Tax=Pseudokineococcus basanitobsidens TaxID=1926649 RepID=A0ABU8RP82_9ACTN
MSTLPPPPPDLAARPRAWKRLRAGSVLWRIHFTAGEHPMAWDGMRYFGRTTSRFDPQAQPCETAGPDPRGVAYLATDLPTALAEVFQRTRVVDTRRGEPYLTALATAHDLDLLDLAGTASLRLGAAGTIAGDRDFRATQAWARAIVTTWPETPGLWCASAMSQQPCVTLYDPGVAPIFPTRPALSLPLSHPGLLPWLVPASEEIGFTLL